MDFVHGGCSQSRWLSLDKQRDRRRIINNTKHVFQVKNLAELIEMLKIDWKKKCKR